MTLEDRCKAQLGQLLFDVMSLQQQVAELSAKVQELEFAAQADKPPPVEEVFSSATISSGELSGGIKFDIED